VAELSDGDILTAKPGTLILIDEPERHLHRSIISPLLKLLFSGRKDCAFIVSTHELMLPIDTPQAATLLVRSCEYEGQDVRAWTVDMLPPGAPIDERLKSDLLGARRRIIFVEGTFNSLDAPLYSLLFPQVSIIAKDGCREVEHAVRGLRGAEGMHWISTWGIVDNDQRSPEDIERLRNAGIWALAHYSVESLYYHPATIARVAKRQAEMTGADTAALIDAALAVAVDAAKSQKDHLVISAVLRAARDKVQTSLPTRDNIKAGDHMKVEIDVAALWLAEETRFEALVAAADWNGLLVRYPLRESTAFTQIVKALTLSDRETYRAAVLKLLQDEPAALTEMRGFLGALFSEVMSEPRSAAG
jgi:hypothetical protein